MNNEYDALIPLGRRKLIEVMNFTVMVLVAALGTLRFVLIDYTQIPYPALFVFIGALLNAIYIRRHGSANVSAVFIILLLVLGLIYAGYTTGAFSGPIVILAPLIPILSMLLIDSHKKWITLVMVCLILSTLFFLELNGVIPENPNSPIMISLGRFITVMALCIVTAWIVWVFANMSRILLQNLEQKSITDYLTGILNRSGIEGILIREVNRAKRSNDWLSVILADVDSFKLYNDTNGHQAGDSCLIKIAKTINSCCVRATDSVGRYGGEEFMIILPETNPEGARQLAENIRATVLNCNIPYGPRNADPVSLTLGVVSGKGFALESVESLVKLADDALYQGKCKSRNCVIDVALEEIDRVD